MIRLGLDGRSTAYHFHALILCKIRYALCAWSGHITEAHNWQINAFLRRMHRYGYVSAVFNIDDMIMLLTLNCFRRCVKCITVLITSCPK